MAAEKLTVLVVDDEPEMRDLHKLLLVDSGFTVLEAANGFEALEVLQKNDNNNVDAVISDVIMPEKNGYELCAEVKELDVLNDIPFIFISSLDGLEEMSKGYACGADDYMVKPLEARELSYKVKNLIRRRNSNCALNDQVAESRDAAMNIMTFYGDMGQVLEFYKSSGNTKNTCELAELLFNTTSSFDLKCSIQFQINGERQNFGDTGEISPLEANVLELARERGRFYSFSTRLIINYANFSLLIKNMPIENEERTGTLRDSLGVLCEAIESRIKSLIVQSENNKKNEIAELIQGALNKTQQAFKFIEQENIASIDTMMDDIEESFISLGLSDEQENRIRNIVANCNGKIHQTCKHGEALNGLFGDIGANLDEIQNTGG